MTAAELMKPRFEVIADYPNNKHNIGRILTPVKDNSNYYDCEEDPFPELIGFPDKYPHLFRKLNWWEYRKAEDMPKKLICKAIEGDNEITEVTEWDMDILVGWIDKKERTCASLRCFTPEYGYFPVD